MEEFPEPPRFPSMTRGSGEFAPYLQENYSFYPDIILAVFILIDENITNIEQRKR